MEKKTRGKIEIDKNKTPIENVISIMGLVYPLETSVAKLDTNFRLHNEIHINKITICPVDERKYQADSMAEFKRIAFSTRWRKSRHRNEKNLSIPIRKGKVSISDVIWAFGTLVETKKETDEKDKKAAEERAAEEAKEAAKKQEITNLMQESHISDDGKIYLDTQYGDEGKYRISITSLTKEQVIQIGNAIYNEWGAL